MKKHILPIGSLVLVIIVIGYLLYQYFEKGNVTGDVWLIKTDADGNTAPYGD